MTVLCNIPTKYGKKNNWKWTIILWFARKGKAKLLFFIEFKWYPACVVCLHINCVRFRCYIRPKFQHYMRKKIDLWIGCRKHKTYFCTPPFFVSQNVSRICQAPQRGHKCKNTVNKLNQNFWFFSFLNFKNYVSVRVISLSSTDAPVQWRHCSKYPYIYEQIL